MFTYLTQPARPLVACLLLAGCVTVDPSPDIEPSAACQGPNCLDAGPPGAADNDDDDIVASAVILVGDAGSVGAQAVDAAAAAPAALVAICPDQCLPDDPTACAEGAQASEPDASAAAIGSAKTNSSGKVAPRPIGDASVTTDAAISATRGPPLALQDAEVPMPEEQPSSGLSCQVVISDGESTASCLPAGFVGVDGECLTSRDCLAGLACVGGGSCRPFCCEGQTVCSEGSFCETRELRSSGSSSVVSVPVCVPPEPCQIDCRSDDCKCADDTKACTILDNQGTVGCREVGEGKQGEACPCAAGYICSETFNQCLKICEAGVDMCDPGLECQGGRLGVPDGWGLCASSFEAENDSAR